MIKLARTTSTGGMSRCSAKRSGRRAGRDGLSVEEVADTEYLVRLRRKAENDLAEIAARLSYDLSALVAQETGGADDLALARRDALVERARALAEVRVADYELLCAAFGESWRRHHRDRRIARLGWRCPRLTAGVEVGGHVFR